MRKILLLLICLSFLAVSVFANELGWDWTPNGSCESGTDYWTMESIGSYSWTTTTEWATHSTHSCKTTKLTLWDNQTWYLYLDDGGSSSNADYEWYYTVEPEVHKFIIRADNDMDTLKFELWYHLSNAPNGHFYDQKMLSFENTAMPIKKGDLIQLDFKMIKEGNHWYYFYIDSVKVYGGDRKTPNLEDLTYVPFPSIANEITTYETDADGYNLKLVCGDSNATYNLDYSNTSGYFNHDTYTHHEVTCQKINLNSGLYGRFNFALQDDDASCPYNLIVADTSIENIYVWSKDVSVLEIRSISSSGAEYLDRTICQAKFTKYLEAGEYMFCMFTDNFDIQYKSDFLTGTTNPDGTYTNHESTGVGFRDLWEDDTELYWELFTESGFTENICSGQIQWGGDPTCAFTDEFPIGDTPTWCKLKNQYNEYSELELEIISTEAGVHNSVILVNVTPDEPFNEDNLTATVVISHLDDVNLTNEYFWHKKIDYTSGDDEWILYSSGVPIYVSGILETGITYSVPDVPANATTQGNFWRLTIESYDGDTIESADDIVGIEVVVEGLITDIENVTHEEDWDMIEQQAVITFLPTNESEQIIFKVNPNLVGIYNLYYVIENSLNDGKQYFIYSADVTDYANDLWTFEQSLTYGTGSPDYDDPIQKIWDGEKYIYTFAEFEFESKYYKLTYTAPMRQWSYLHGSLEWYRLFEPVLTDINGLSWDIYTVSVYSNIRSELIEELADLDGDDCSYEFQFTAYTNIAGTEILVGDYIVTLTEIPHRYSITLDGTTLLKFITAVNTSKIIYMSDIAIMQKSFFKTKIDLLQENYDPLNIWITEEEITYAPVVDGDDDEWVQITESPIIYGQVFNAESTSIKSISLKMYKDANAVDTTLRMGVFRVNDGNIESPYDYAVSQTPVPIGVGNADWVTLTFSPALSITTDYVAFNIMTTDGATGYYVSRDNDESVYPDGYAMENGVDVNKDFSFKVKNTAGDSYSYINEGNPFRSGVVIYDRDGTLDSMTVKVYAYTEDDVNVVMNYTRDLSMEVGEIRDLDELIPPIILITEDGGTLSPVKVSITLCSDTNNQCESTSVWVQLHNYPFLFSDRIIQTYERARQPNTAPYGKVILRGSVPNAFTDVEMKIYKGSFVCLEGAIGTTINDGETLCTSGNTASVVANKFNRTFYKGIDFTCSSLGVCDFDYDLENEYHFAEEGEYTTFGVVGYNTDDSNLFYSRTKYSITKPNLLVLTEYQGLDGEYFTDFNCFGNLAGIVETGHTIETYEEAVLGTDMFSQLVEWGATNLVALANWTDSFFNTEFTPDPNSPLTLLAYGNIGCGITIPSTLNLKIVAHVYTQRNDDISDYIGNSYFRIRKNIGGEFISPRLYPIDYFYDSDKGRNELVWNTVMYDDSGGYLPEDDYELVFYVYDESGQNHNSIDEYDTYLDLVIDNSVVVQEPEDLSFIPMDLYSAKGDTLTMRSFIATRDRYVDELEFILFTDKSRFSVGNSDKENQIIRFSIDAEDLYRLEDKLDFNVSREFSTFRQEYSNADYIGGCLGGGVVGAGALFLVGAGLTATGVGIPAGLTLSTLAIAGGLSGCGLASVTNWSNDTSANLVIDESKIRSMEQFEYQKYKSITIQIKNPAINDYSELVKWLDSDDNTTSPYTIIDDLAKENKSSPLADLEILIAGKKYTFENVLVGEGEFYEELTRGNVKLRINAYYDYHSRTKQKTMDIFTLQSQGTDAVSYLTSANKGIVWFIQNYAILLITATLLLVAIAYISVIFRRK